MKRKAYRFWPALLVLFLADCTTKQLAEERLKGAGSLDVVGDLLRLTLAYNPGAAFSISLGEYSRWSLTALTILIVGVLLRMYHEAPRGDTTLGGALGLVVGGALGNMLDRVRSPNGVVDFIDIGVGDIRFWIFNIADIGITLGAVLLAALVWKREGWLPAPFDTGDDGAAAIAPGRQHGAKYNADPGSIEAP